ncbi:MAG: ATP-binding protein [Elusimicrobia bacterium]|nr:ATP-binding protein [Elusimicrobiota bacterium]
MKLHFLNRADEQKRLARALGADGGALAVVYGRRRCGKSTLIQRVVGNSGVYYLADQKETSLQLRDLAAEIDRLIPGFSSAAYSGWDALLATLNDRLTGSISLFLDEVPYLVQLSPELPSILQKYIDRPGAKKINIVLCGSSQRMMHGLVMDKAAPLYGRAVEILKLKPLNAGWIRPGLKLKGAEAVEAFSVWGGVPRYWELAAQFGKLEEAISELILDPNGVLREEPMRLLTDDMRSAVQPYSLLSVIGQGCHRLSEIAARLGKPASSILRPLLQLVDLGYVRRETPFGENSKSTKRTLYKLDDPFLIFYFKFLQPNKSQLEVRAIPPVLAKIRGQFQQHVAGIWEELARASVPFCTIGGYKWGAAKRWWGPGIDGAIVELDGVAESLDGKALLVGEAKWSDAQLPAAGLKDRLLAKAKNCAFTRGRSIVPVIWAKQGRKNTDVQVLAPDEVLDCLQ